MGYGFLTFYGAGAVDKPIFMEAEIINHYLLYLDL